MLFANLVHQVGGIGINRVLRHINERSERTVEGSVTHTASGDEHRSAGRWRPQRQDRTIAQLLQSLRDVRGPDDVLAITLRLAELEHDCAARSAIVRLVSGQKPVEMKQSGESPNVYV